MLYRAIGLMSGSSLDGLDIAFVEFLEEKGKWTFDIKAADCYPYPVEWQERLKNAVLLNAREYQLLHSEYGHYLGREVNRFIEENNLHFQVGLISSHGHTSFHLPPLMTAQLGDGAAIAAETGLVVVSDLRALDVALGGQGAPIVPIGEKLLFDGYDLFLNLGGIANISINAEKYSAFDVCPANRVLNMIAAKANKEYDAGGAMAAMGIVNTDLLHKLNALEYYSQPAPKSLANDFGTGVVYPLIRSFGLTHHDELSTFTQHIVQQISNAIPDGRGKLLITGGGAFNTFLVEQLSVVLQSKGVEVVIPDTKIVQYKEALIMALIGVLRWRQESNVFSSVTGAQRDSIGGALWMGQEG